MPDRSPSTSQVQETSSITVQVGIGPQQTAPENRLGNAVQTTAATFTHEDAQRVRLQAQRGWEEVLERARQRGRVVRLEEGRGPILENRPPEREGQEVQEMLTNVYGAYLTGRGDYYDISLSVRIIYGAFCVFDALSETVSRNFMQAAAWLPSFSLSNLGSWFGGRHTGNTGPDVMLPIPTRDQANEQALVGNSRSNMWNSRPAQQGGEAGTPSFDPEAQPGPAVQVNSAP